MTYVPEHLETYDGFKPTQFDSHICGELDSFYIAPVSTDRDADILTRVNWDVVTDEILRHSSHDETAVHTFGHWANGWFELLLIHPADTGALECAEEWACALAQYPVADDELYSEAEYEAAGKWWDSCGLRQRIAACARYGVSIFAARRDEIPQDRTGGLVSYLAS